MEDGDIRNSDLTNENLITDIIVMMTALKYP